MKRVINTIFVSESFLLYVVLGLSCLAGFSLGGPALEESISGPGGAKGFVAYKGGSIRMYRDLTKNGTNKTLMTGEIGILFAELRELNSNYSQVTDADKRVHSVSAFTDQMFTCTADKNRKLPFSDVTGECVVCTTRLKNFNATEFRTSSCVTTKNGSINQDDETAIVKEGQLKFTIEIYNWPWCNASCAGGAGQYIDLDLGIKIPSGEGRVINKAMVNGSEAFMMNHRPTKYTLGGGAAVEFSRKVYIDGAWKNVTSGFPLFKNGTNMVTLRFPYFNERMLYDPTVETGDVAYAASTHPSSAPSSLHGLKKYQSALLILFSVIVGTYKL